MIIISTIFLLATKSPNSVSWWIVFIEYHLRVRWLQRLTHLVLRTRLYILSGMVGCHCLNRRGSPGSEASEICSGSSERPSPGLQWALPGSAKTLLFPLHESPRSPGMELLSGSGGIKIPGGPWMTLGPKLKYLWKVKATRHSPGGPTNTELSCCLQWGQQAEQLIFLGNVYNSGKSCPAGVIYPCYKVMGRQWESASYWNEYRIQR